MKLAFFLTSGTSIELWKNRGWLEGGSAIKSYNAWAEHFEKIYFLTYGERDEIYHEYFSSKVKILPKKIKVPNWIYSFLVPFLYKKELKECDLYVTSQMEGSWSAALSKLLFGNKFILRCGYQWALSTFDKNLKGRIAKIFAPLLEALMYKISDNIIVTSNYAKDHISLKHGVAETKISIIPNPVDTSLFKPTGINKKLHSIIYVGRLEREKNPHALFEAVVGLDIKLSIFGTGSEEKELQQFALNHNLDVIFHRNVPAARLADEFNMHEIFVIPSLYENSPKALLEAMSSGMAVIGTDVRGIKEIIRNNENGILCEPTPEGIRKAIIELQKDYLKRERLGNKAREYILKYCALENKIKQDLEIFGV